VAGGEDLEEPGLLEVAGETTDPLPAQGNELRVDGIAALEERQVDADELRLHREAAGLHGELRRLGRRHRQGLDGGCRGCKEPMPGDFLARVQDFGPPVDGRTLGDLLETLVPRLGVSIGRRLATLFITAGALENIVQLVLDILALLAGALGDIVYAVLAFHHHATAMARHAAPSLTICSWATLSWSSWLSASSKIRRSSSVRRGKSSASNASACRR
jgi:hypothetical protein